MDDIADSVNELSLNAKEWRPGFGFAPTPKSSSSLAGVASADGASIDNTNNNSSQQQQQQAVDVNGTHFFGSAVASTQHSNSWEGNTSSGDSSSSRTQTTTPSYHYQQTQQSQTNRPSRSTLRNTLSLPLSLIHI